MHRRSFYRARPKDRPADPPDRVVIFATELRKLLAIHAYYEARSERVGGIILFEQEQERFEAVVSDSAFTSFNVKLLATDDGVREYGREQLL